MATIDFLKTVTSKDKLKVALEVIMEYKACEDQTEYLNNSFECWMKLEELQEHLEKLTDSTPHPIDYPKLLDNWAVICNKKMRETEASMDACKQDSQKHAWKKGRIEGLILSQSVLARLEQTNRGSFVKYPTPKTTGIQGKSLRQVIIDEFASEDEK